LIEQATAQKVQSGTEEFELQAEKRFKKIEDRRTEIEGLVTKMQVDLEDISIRIGTLGDQARRIEESFLEVQNEEEFDKQLKRLEANQKELAELYS